ncbi:MAG TPA: DUF4350 domain-containing protein, partial [Gemmataceae bacterium]
MTRAAAPTRAPLPRAGVLSAALAALLAAGAGAQPPAPRPLSPAGTEALRFLLKKEGIEPLRRISDLPRGVSRTMVIILGDTTGLKGTKSWPLHFGPFLSSGGSILIATDRPLAFVDDMNPLDRSSDFLRIPGTLLESTDPRACYRGLSFCPFVSPDLGEHAGDQRFEPFRPLFDSLTSVATNNPSHIEMVKPGAFIPLAAFPPSAREVGTRHRAGHFAAGTTEGRGRLLVLADHSVFINEMILQPDNDNFDFALNCINWLRQNNADGQPPRDR